MASARNWQLNDKTALVPGDNDIATAIREALSAEGATVITERSQPVDILVNAAADIRDPSKTALDADSNSWAADMERCFEGPRRLAHQVLPDMIGKGFGRIISVVGSFEPMHFNSEFTAWGATAAWAKSLTREVGPHGVTVNLIQPGLTDTKETRALWAGEDMEAYANKRIPVGRLCAPSDIANLVVYLCSPYARYLTGIILPVDGGMGRHQH